MENIGFIIYFTGCFITCMCVLYDAYKASKNNESLEELPGVLSALTITSWVVVILYIIRYIKN